jgi:hypothetical protein
MIYDLRFMISGGRAGSVKNLGQFLGFHPKSGNALGAALEHRPNKSSIINRKS